MFMLKPSYQPILLVSPKLIALWKGCKRTHDCHRSKQHTFKWKTIKLSNEKRFFVVTYQGVPEIGVEEIGRLLSWGFAACLAFSESSLRFLSFSASNSNWRLFIVALLTMLPVLSNVTFPCVINGIWTFIWDRDSAVRASSRSFRACGLSQVLSACDEL